ncbi:hypothetical protein BpHYR1_026547 [Brachionus plicatilis]|uniref:Uncharacterized protein n=1 Tax=Brachionus plicatilis TaxID=10195 RepID=A0A3M7SCQ8_BRAPC|nr:hypothetical protein BpHYR1_026547 [Brachionus plicatilis]
MRIINLDKNGLNGEINLFAFGRSGWTLMNEQKAILFIIDTQTVLLIDFFFIIQEQKMENKLFGLIMFDFWFKGSTKFQILFYQS